NARLLELEPGDVTIHHCLLLHGSGPNRSNRARKTLILRMFDGDCRLDPARLPAGGPAPLPTARSRRLAPPGGPRPFLLAGRHSAAQPHGSVRADPLSAGRALRMKGASMRALPVLTLLMPLACQKAELAKSIPAVRVQKLDRSAGVSSARYSASIEPETRVELAFKVG